MENTEIREVSENCSIELQCTENSHPFETRTITLAPGSEKQIGRYSKKHRNASLDETLVLFDNRILSHTHALIYLQEGKLYLKDLCSCNGTYLNGENIGPENDEGNEPKPREIKTGDVLRFGNVRRANGKQVLPIEAKLTIKFSSTQTQDEANSNEKSPENFTPYEGRQIEQTTAKAHGPGKLAYPSIHMVIQGKNHAKTCSTADRGTVTEETSFCDKSIQIIDDREDERPITCENCKFVSEEFYRYRKRALIVIAICLTVMILYQQLMKF